MLQRSDVENLVKELSDVDSHKNHHYRHLLNIESKLPNSVIVGTWLCMDYELKDLMEFLLTTDYFERNE